MTPQFGVSLTKWDKPLSEYVARILVEAESWEQPRPECWKAIQEEK